MQEDFHYYATYCAAYLAGYSHEESRAICYSAQFVDCCSKTLLQKVGAPQGAATTQLQLELMDSRTDPFGLMDITRIWTAFHFLPQNLYAEVGRGSLLYKNKYRLLCGPNGNLVADTVKLAKGKSLQAVGIAMHVLADTWAHSNFAGTPSFVINNTNTHFFELFSENGETIRRKVTFRHSPTAQDHLDSSVYTNSLFQSNENSIMNLGHGRAGHFPDYSFARYEYLPAWKNYEILVKDNPSDYLHAFAQMIYAMRFLRGEIDHFETDCYDWDTVNPFWDKIKAIIGKRQLNASEDWKNFGETLSGQKIIDFDCSFYEDSYTNAVSEKKADTDLGRFIQAALEHKNMVGVQMIRSGNFLAGIPETTQMSGIGKLWLKFLHKIEGGADHE